MRLVEDKEVEKENEEEDEEADQESPNQTLEVVKKISLNCKNNATKLQCEKDSSYDFDRKILLTLSQVTIINIFNTFN